MSRTLSPAGNRPQLIGPTTTIKLAQRMICALHETAACLPPGFDSSIVMDILLTLYLQEESASYPGVADLMPSGSTSPAVTARWVDALVQRGLIDRSDDLLALSTAGHAIVVELIERIYAAQRLLD